MTCHCHTSSLRIFIRSLTRIQVPSATQLPTRHLVPGSHVLNRQNGALRSFAAASAAQYPRKSWRGATEHKDTPSGHYAQPENPSDSITAAGRTTAKHLDQARDQGTILDFSAETIDALAANLQETSDYRAPKHAQQADYETEFGHSTRRKAALTGSSKLRRSKIMPKDDKRPGGAEGEDSEKLPMWRIQKAALKEKFPEGWQPRKKLSPDALEGIRALNKQYPQEYTTEVLAQKFEVSPEAIRRILRSKWTPSVDEEIDRQERWYGRGKKIWSQLAELGTKPPKRWRREGIVRDPRWNERRGPRTHYPYVPRHKEQDPEDEESTQRKLGGNLL